MTKRTSGLFFFLILLSLLFLTTNLMKESIYEDTRVPYNNYYFSNCNPCKWTFTVSKERNTYEKVIFDAYVNYRTSVGRECGCVNIRELGNNCRQPCGPCYKSNTELCKLMGYKDSGGGCGYCGSCDIVCYRDLSETTDWIELRDGSDVIVRFDSGIENEHKKINLAPYINKYCGDEINKCRETGECDYECSFDLYAYSQNNGGKLKILSEPSETEYGPYRPNPLDFNKIISITVNLFQNIIDFILNIFRGVI